MPEPAVAVAVVSWNNRELLAATLRSLEPEFRVGNAEVWVVDNASADGSAGMVRDEFPWVNLIESERNIGYGSAVNLVAGRTATEWLAPANDDIELRPGALERMLRTGAQCEQAGAIAPRLVLADGSTQHSVQSFPSVALGLVYNLGIYRLSRRLADRLCIPRHWDQSRRREVPWAIATWLLVRRRAWDEVGGFDESQWMYAEDLDLGWRLRRAGWKTLYEPDASVFHVDSAASRQAFGDEVVARHMEASYTWMAKRLGIVQTRLIASLNVAGAALRLAAYAALAALRPERYRARRDGYRHWVHVHRAGLKPREELLRGLGPG